MLRHRDSSTNSCNCLQKKRCSYPGYFLEQKSKGVLNGHIGVTKDPIVSSDVVGSQFSGIIDTLATIGVGKDKLKLLIWFDNGWGYASQIIDLIKKISDEGKYE